MATPGRPLMTGFDPATLRVVANVPQTQVAAIQAGAGARIEVPSANTWLDVKSITVVPREAVVRRSEVTAVYVVGDDTRPLLRQIRLGAVSDDRAVEVLSGLKPGERVASDPIAAGMASSATVTLQITKKAGENAVEVAEQVLARIEDLRNTNIPADVHVTVMRNYGATANDKAQQLIMKLLFATISVVVLVFATLGWREACIVGVAVLLTLAATLFASWAWGFTLNRVSLFALIFRSASWSMTQSSWCKTSIGAVPCKPRILRCRLKARRQAVASEMKRHALSSQ